MKISVLGCGRWGSYIAWYLDKIGNDVLSWGLSDAPEFIELKTTRKNNNLSFRESIKVSDNLEEAVTHGEVIIISISSQHLRQFISDVAKFDLTGKTFVLCMKGIEDGTGKRLSE
ncbi:MAG: NAD(P)-binding domain-containing protein, partial [Bacillota bacterium]|nr:NAD(P)-binding domain-containing protein [Bacillota bacterium]